MLGVMLLSRDAATLAADSLRPDQFYRPAYGKIFAAIVALVRRGEPADAVTVADELIRTGELAAVGGAETLLAIQAGSPAASNAERYASIITEMAAMRRLISVGAEIAELGWSMPGDVAAALDEAQAMVMGVDVGSPADEVRSVVDASKAFLARLEELYEHGAEVTGLPTGLTDLDRLLLGLQPGALILAAGRPGMGKTVFGLSAAAHAAIELGRPTLVFSLEMGESELMQRLYARTAHIDATALRKGKLDMDDWLALDKAARTIEAAPLYIVDEVALTVSQLRTIARRLHRQLGGNLALVVVDYVQLLAPEPRVADAGDNARLEIASRALKVLARELKTPVLALAQLNRDVERRADKRPVLADLRGSGSLEQDADVVIGLYRDEVYHPDTEDRGVAEVNVLKHRAGETGEVRAAWRGAFQRFDNLSRLTS